MESTKEIRIDQVRPGDKIVKSGVAYGTVVISYHPFNLPTLTGLSLSNGQVVQAHSHTPITVTA